MVEFIYKYYGPVDDIYHLIRVINLIHIKIRFNLKMYKKIWNVMKRYQSQKDFQYDIDDEYEIVYSTLIVSDHHQCKSFTS